MSWKVVPAELPDLKCVAQKKNGEKCLMKVIFRTASALFHANKEYLYQKGDIVIGHCPMDKLDFSVSKRMGNPLGAFKIFLFDKLKVLPLLPNCWNLYSVINLPRLNSKPTHTHPCLIHTHPHMHSCARKHTHTHRYLCINMHERHTTMRHK